MLRRLKRARRASLHTTEVNIAVPGNTTFMAGVIACTRDILFLNRRSSEPPIQFVVGYIATAAARAKAPRSCTRSRFATP
jgi:hypothetical protein